MRMNTILRVIDQERERKGVSERQLALAAGMSESAYKQWMRGVATPKLSSIIAVLDQLGIVIVLRRTTHEKHDNE